jgi:hypothetical protein
MELPEVFSFQVRLFLRDPLLRAGMRKQFGLDIPTTPESLRDIGAMIRNVISRLWETEIIVELDFGNEALASGSLFDELAKLFDEYPKEEVKRRLKFVNIDEWDQHLFLHLAKMRLEDQAKKAAQLA